MYLGGLARSGFAHHHHDLVLADDVQQLLPGVVHWQELALLRDGLGLGKLALRLPAGKAASALRLHSQAAFGAEMVHHAPQLGASADVRLSIT